MREPKLSERGGQTVALRRDGKSMVKAMPASRAQGNAKGTDFARELNANTADDTPMQNES
jgi:hypothetical protein